MYFHSASDVYVHKGKFRYANSFADVIYETCYRYKTIFWSSDQVNLLEYSKSTKKLFQRSEVVLRFPYDTESEHNLAEENHNLLIN